MTSQSSGTSAPPQVSRLQESIPELLKQHEVAGLAAACVREGRCEWSGGFGFADEAGARPVTAETIFEAGSLSKPVSAYCALQLWERGVLELDAPLMRYLPDPFMPNEPRLRVITARMALSHTTGMQGWREPGAPLRLIATPGRHFTYSGEAYVYLQRVVERLTGQSLDDYARRNLFEPFGMADSSYAWEERFETRAARSFDEAGRIDRSLMWDYAHGAATPPTASAAADAPELAMPNAASGLYTTAADYARFLVELMRPAAGDEFHLSARGTDEMLKERIRVGDAIGWGLGWGLQQTARGDAFFHWADQNSFQHFAIGFRDEQSALVVLTNSVHGLKVCRALASEFVGADLPLFSALAG
ncbi:MAG: serine hydrolase domain-containing protein [Pyrinomonadaceae bacterium]